MSPKFAPPAPPADLNRFLRKFKIDQVVLVLFLWVLTFVMSACSLSGQSGNNFSAPTTTSATRNSKPERISRGLTVKPSTSARRAKPTGSGCAGSFGSVHSFCPQSQQYACNLVRQRRDDYPHRFVHRTRFEIDTRFYSDRNQCG